MALVMAHHKEVVDGPAVRHDETVVIPFSAEDVLQKERASAARVAVITVVCAHELADITFLYKCLESRKIGLPKVF